MKIFIETVGCFKNREDSERMAGLLARAGHEVLPAGSDAADADAIVVNTCGFIEAAKQESIETIFAYAPLRAQGKRLVVTGCLAQRYAAELADELPEADVLLGVNDYERLPAILGQSEKTVVAESAPSILLGERVALESRHTRYLKIAEGCDNRCTYCVIPQIRGPYRSAPRDALLGEAAQLAREGCKELILIAQDVTNYGADLEDGGDLSTLLQGLAGTDGVEWIRLLYCYEERITDALIEAVAREPKVCRYIDIPLQHVSAPVLKRMGRRSTPDGIRRTIARLREAVPDIVIRTTFITGFPGETDADFEALADFLEEQRLGRVGVFAYSREEGTPAADMPDQVPREVAEARKDALMQIQQGISLAHNRALVGTVQDVLIDAREEDCFVGRTRGDAPEIDGEVLVEAAQASASPVGRIVPVRITDALDYDLVGELVSP
ncbi:MAG: 30S ribosomal protein S12 methylthiotransferase RimO [Clostridiales Family XIII bacterium]|jgi:ribosomal protein S12 methylthiotransferase|nr:30S ribosomal protein S12 methylthiotransferase RimO [Clostridiales Family XIII bacterium]